MKNIHVLPTDEPSRLVKIYNEVEKKSFLLKLDIEVNDNFKEYQNIYITSDEDINENDYIITKDGRLVQVSYLLSEDLEGASKVIITTDQDLIKDGLQAIDDEFLEWFVKNPSCEFVEVSTYHVKGDISGKLHYKIIIPKEEPKQETLEELAEKLQEEIKYGASISDIIDTLTKWQQEQAKEIFEQQIIDAYQQGFNNAYFNNPLSKEQYYNEQFKNK